MTIKQFIQCNRVEIDSIVREFYGQVITNDKDRLEWILNDKGLYAWAHQEGVNI